MNIKKKDGRSRAIPMKRKIKQYAKAGVTKNISDQLDGGEELRQSTEIDINIYEGLSHQQMRQPHFP